VAGERLAHAEREYQQAIQVMQSLSSETGGNTLLHGQGGDLDDESDDSETGMTVFLEQMIRSTDPIQLNISIHNALAQEPGHPFTKTLVKPSMLKAPVMVRAENSHQTQLSDELSHEVQHGKAQDPTEIKSPY
ncbi:hypothetical protein C0995_000797, partial [Termitomyces sp. Mi166